MDPYSGDLYHNSPIVLWLTSALITHIPRWIPFLFIVIDLLAGCFLYTTAKKITQLLLQRQTREFNSYAKDTKEFLINSSSQDTVPQFVLIAYLFNPYSIMNCVGQTTTVWSNFLLAGFLLGMSHKQLLLSVTCLAIEVQQNMYPLILIVPLIINQATITVGERDKTENEKNNKKPTKDNFIETTFKWTKAIPVIASIAVVMGGVAYLNFAINHQQWNFVDSTFGFM